MTENKADFESEKPGGVSRRTVTKGMAWAVPAIAIAAPVPAFAAASEGPLTLEGTGCKLPGNSNATYKGYAFNLTAQNPRSDVAGCVRINTVTLNGESLGQRTVVNLATGQCAVLGNPFCVPPNTTLSDLAIVTANAASSEQRPARRHVFGRPDRRLRLVQCGTTGFEAFPPASTDINDAPPINGASCTTTGPETKFTVAQKACLAALALSN